MINPKILICSGIDSSFSDKRKLNGSFIKRLPPLESKGSSQMALSTTDVNQSLSFRNKSPVEVIRSTEGKTIKTESDLTKLVKEGLGLENGSEKSKSEDVKNEQNDKESKELRIKLLKIKEAFNKFKVKHNRIMNNHVTEYRDKLKEELNAYKKRTQDLEEKLKKTKEKLKQYETK